MKGIPYKGPYVVRYNERTGQAMYIVGALDALGCPTVCDMPNFGVNPSAKSIADLNATAKLLAASWNDAVQRERMFNAWSRLDAALAQNLSFSERTAVTVDAIAQMRAVMQTESSQAEAQLSHVAPTECRECGRLKPEHATHCSQYAVDGNG